MLTLSARWGLVGLAALATSCGWLPTRPTQEESPVILRTDVAEQLNFSIRNRQTEQAEVAASELSAACQAMFDAEIDVLVGDALILTSNRLLLRSAELLDTGAFDHPVAAAAESLIVAGIVEWADLRAALLVEYSSDEVDSIAQAFFDERKLPPTNDAAASYVVYFAQKKLGETHVVRQRIDPLTTLPSGTRRTAAMVRPDGSRISIPSDWCVE